ncbi:MAG TPA: S41 family peptidase [Pyrinomonadaceae bacterium]|nr:S41 family peptidase [Pyrinomonadaceae bacterium]
MFKLFVPPTRALRHTLLLMSLSLCVCAAAGQAQQTTDRVAQPTRKADAPSTLSRAARIEIFEEVWSTIDEKYYDPSFNGVAWKDVRERYRPRVEGVESDEEFYRVLNQMTGELRDSHTRVRSPRQRAERKKRVATSAGVIVYEIEGTPVVFDVTPDSDAARAGVEAGMVVRTVGGRPVTQALAEARREVGTSSSERASRILSYLKLIAGEPNTPLALGLVRADGTPLEVSLMRRTISAEPQFTARLLPSGYAYIRFTRFRSPVGKQVKEALEKFKDAPGLVLDLRANGGGDGEEGMRIAGYFLNEKTPVARIVTRTGKPPSALFGLVSLPKVFEAGRTGGQLYSGPVVILVNEGTGSTSELITGALQEHGRARVVGTQSCGCVLGVLDHRELKGGGELSVSEVSFVTAKGRTLEGLGVVPDTPLKLTLADFRRRQDTGLAEAEKVLKQMQETAARSPR